jgi:hypothetical protein
MAIKYVAVAALQELVTKTKSLVDAVKGTAESALSAAQTASTEAKLHGTCATAAETNAKVVECTNFKSLETGVRVAVKFTYANTAGTATLNVNSTGAKSIYWLGSSDVTNAWVASEVCIFEYDGTNWNLVNKGKGITSWTGFTGANPVSKGGTGATDAATARTNLGITLDNLGAAASSHSHALTDCTGTLTVAKGGTGATDAATARSNLGITLANLGAAASSHSHALTDCTGTLSIAKGGTGSTTAAAALSALGGAKMALYSASINTSWTTNSSGGYYKTVTVSGILATDVPVVGIVMSDDVSAATLQGKAFANVNRITTAANSITLYAYSTAPTTAFTLQLLVVRSA